MIFIKKELTIVFVLFHISLSMAQEWIGNNIGKNNNVPAPWHSLRVSNLNNNAYSISCWGRNYVFDGTSLLKEINVFDKNILYQPLRIEYGNKRQWDVVSSRIIKQEAKEVQLEFTTSIKENAIQVINKIFVSIYYDGLIYYKLQMSSSQPLDKPIQISFSMNKDDSEFIHRWANVSSQQKKSWYSGRFTKNITTDYIPYFWIGNQDKGLFWFAESPYNWLNYKKNNAISFFRDSKKGDASVKLSITDVDLLKISTWSFEFGIQATPVKPMPNNWRSWQLGGMDGSNMNVIWPTVGKNYSLKYFGYPEAVNIIKYKEHVRKLQKDDRKALSYLSLSYLSKSTPEWSKYKSTWDIKSFSDQGGDVASYGEAFTRINSTDKNYQDFILWKSEKFLKEASLDGYYVDNVMIVDLNRFELVKSYNSDNQKFPYFPIMKTRELHERFYKMVKSINSNKMILMHSSTRIVTPILGFADAVVNGEQFRTDLKRQNGDYLEVTSLDNFQSEFSNKQYGVPIIFLPEFEPKFYKTSTSTRYLASILLQHDLLVWPNFSYTPVWVERYRLLTSFPDYQQAEFIPYYSFDTVLKANSKGVIGSVYRNTKGDYLCVVSNLNKTTFKGKIEFKDGNITLDNYKLLVQNNRNFSRILSNHRIEVTIAPQDFAAFYLLKK